VAESLQSGVVCRGGMSGLSVTTITVFPCKIKSRRDMVYPQRP
jgi:hypothetical protein